MSANEMTAGADRRVDEKTRTILADLFEKANGADVCLRSASGLSYVADRQILRRFILEAVAVIRKHQEQTAEDK